MKRIVMGHDGSAHSDSAVRLGGKLRPPKGGRVTLVTAIDPAPMPAHPFLSRYREAPRKPSVEFSSAGSNDASRDGAGVTGEDGCPTLANGGFAAALSP